MDSFPFSSCYMYIHIDTYYDADYFYFRILNGNETSMLLFTIYLIIQRYIEIKISHIAGQMVIKNSSAHLHQ